MPTLQSVCIVLVCCMSVKWAFINKDKLIRLIIEANSVDVLKLLWIALLHSSFCNLDHNLIETWDTNINVQIVLTFFKVRPLLLRALHTVDSWIFTPQASSNCVQSSSRYTSGECVIQASIYLTIKKYQCKIQVQHLQLTSMLPWLSLNGREAHCFTRRTFLVSWNNFKNFWMVCTFTLVCLSMSWTVRFRLWCIWTNTQQRSSDKALYWGMRGADSSLFEWRRKKKPVEMDFDV